MGNPNPKVSEINLFLHSVGKLEMVEVKQKTILRNPEENLNTPPAIIVDKRETIRGTMSYIHRKNSKKMQKYSEK